MEDFSLCWTHMSEGTFSDTEAHIILISLVLQKWCSMKAKCKHQSPYQSMYSHRLITATAVHLLLNTVDVALRKHAYVILTPQTPLLYEKLGFTGVYIIFLISAKNIDCGYSLEPPRWRCSNEYPQSMFWAEIWKVSEFLSENFHFFGGKIFSIFEKGLFS